MVKLHKQVLRAYHAGKKEPPLATDYALLHCCNDYKKAKKFAKKMAYFIGSVAAERETETKPKPETVPKPKPGPGRGRYYVKRRDEEILEILERGTDKLIIEVYSNGAANSLEVNVLEHRHDLIFTISTRIPTAVKKEDSAVKKEDSAVNPDAYVRIVEGDTRDAPFCRMDIYTMWSTSSVAFPYGPISKKDLVATKGKEDKDA